MAFSPRQFMSGHVYELTFRARKGFPLPPKRVIKSLLRSCLGRTQRDFKVHICHFLWMANHMHMVIIIKDAEAAKLFYAELKKKITDGLKAMTGRSYLLLWERRPNVMRLYDIEDVKLKIAYVYANPARAGLVNSIDEYPGYSSIELYKALKDSPVTAKSSELVPWLRLPRIERLPPLLSEATDKFMSEKWEKEAKKKHLLVIEPNLWMACFGVTDQEEVTALNKEIVADLYGREMQFKEERTSQGKSVVGVNRLKKMAIMAEYTPKKTKADRHVFIVCRDKLTRILFIAQFKEFAALCKARYQEWKAGDFSSPWPVGAFRPPMPNAIS